MSARGTIRMVRRGDGTVRWSLYFRRAGETPYEKRFPEFRSVDDRAKVEAAAAPYRIALAAKRRPTEPAEGETFADWFDRYLGWRALQPTGGESVTDSRGRLKKWILPRIGTTPIARVTKVQLEDLVAWLDEQVADEALSAKTAANAWGEVTVGLGVATSAKRATGLRALAINPALGIEGPTKGTTKTNPFLRPDELARLFSHADVPLERRHVYAVATYTACRQGELRALRVRDVDLEAMQISVSKQRKGGVEKARTKTGRARVVTIEPHLVPLLAALTEGRPGDAFLLSVRAHNRCASNLRADLTTAGCTREALHVPRSDPMRAHLVFHSLRGTCGTHMAVRRDPPQDIQWRLGHTTALMTEHYISEARYAAGASFGVPLGPLPTCLIHPEPDEIRVVIGSVIVTTSEAETPTKGWRRRESNPGPKISRLPASTCVSGHLSRPRLRGPARSLWDYPPV